MNKKEKPLLIQNIVIQQTRRSANDIDSWRSALQSAENVLNPRRTNLYDLYSEMLLDAHLSSVIDKRKTAITNTNISYIENGKINEKLIKLIRGQKFTNMLSDILDTKFWGYTLLELSFVNSTVSSQLIPRKHVIPEKNIVILNHYDQTGIDYNLPPYNDYVIKAGEIRDLGLILKAAQYVIYKRYGFADWAQFAEIFGMPFRKATYDGYDENTRVLLENTMKNAGSATSAVLPIGANIEFIPNNSSGSNDLYKSFIDACNAEISKLIVGQTLTTEQGDSGSYNLGIVHKGIEEEIHISDMRFVLSILNEQFKPLLIKHGIPLSPDGEFAFDEIENIALKERIIIDKTVSEIVPVADDYFYETYKIPKPLNYDQLKADKEAQRQLAQLQLQALQAPPADNQEPEDKHNYSPPSKPNLKTLLTQLKSFFQ